MLNAGMTFLALVGVWTAIATVAASLVVQTYTVLILVYISY